MIINIRPFLLLVAHYVLSKKCFMCSQVVGLDNWFYNLFLVITSLFSIYFF
jgi:hypothetical protein